jgi:hypothetical protein
VPILIAMLSDGRIAPTQEPIICFWQDMTIGDIAFCVLSDLFLNADWTETTIPGAGWNEMLGADDNLPAWGSAEWVHCEAREKSPSKVAGAMGQVQRSDILGCDGKVFQAESVRK